MVSMPGRRGIEQQVLVDLSAMTDEVDKLEILDSYGAYTQRVYQAEIAQTYAHRAGDAIASVLGSYFFSQLPPVYVPSRPRMAENPDLKKKHTA
jgi:hypothetical protein